LVRVQSCLPDFIYLSPVYSGLFLFLRTHVALPFSLKSGSFPAFKSGSFPAFAEKYAVNLRQIYA